MMRNTCHGQPEIILRCLVERQLPLQLDRPSLGQTRRNKVIQLDPRVSHDKVSHFLGRVTVFVMGIECAEPPRFPVRGL